ncbi:L-selectin [Boleophthalmus pectinirostris]|uniref:L-selectin n=1 Tax=Boleophthalmus pectinirostris TaxID=150288 RepID=UPI000A1C5790|nr:L-selectin [Boleophthalmus pectinirostris]
MGWTYHYSNVTMNWAAARKWCQAKFTDMVVIQNQLENDYLVSLLPQRNSSPYFWIGITRTYANETWRWIGNNSTWMGSESWDENEPNNDHSAEFCVEIYTSRGRKRGKWNDEKCSVLKYATCYKTECTNMTCDRGRCHETINKVTCLCEPGFVGDRCETVLPAAAADCPPVPDPDNEVLSCSSTNHTFNTTCRVTCSFGLLTIASAHITCQTNGLWSGPRPACASYKKALLAVAGSGAISILCCICFCWMQHRKRKKINQISQGVEEANPSSALSG